MADKIEIEFNLLCDEMTALKQKMLNLDIERKRTEREFMAKLNKAFQLKRKLLSEE